MRKRMFILLIIVIVAGCAIMTMFFWRRHIYNDLCGYTEKTLDIEWKDCIASAVGDVEANWGEEEYAHIKLEVQEGCEEEVLDIIQSRCGESFDLSRTIIPGYQGHEFAMEIKNSDIKYIFYVSMEGKWVKTRSIRIYVVYDENGKMYVYIMG